jgi:hypothetical protein
MSPYHGWPFLSVPHHALLSAGWALIAHGVLGVLVVSPILRRSGRAGRWGAVAFLGASAIDLDHVLAAGSLSFHSMESLSRRPDTHGLPVALVLGVATWGVTRVRLAGWCVFAVVASHLVLDAAGGGTPLLFPFGRAEGIPWLLCPVTIMLMFAISALLALPCERPMRRTHLADV